MSQGQILGLQASEKAGQASPRTGASLNVNFNLGSQGLYFLWSHLQPGAASMLSVSHASLTWAEAVMAFNVPAAGNSTPAYPEQAIADNQVLHV